MIQSIHLDDEYVTVKQSLKETHRRNQGLRLENNIAPEGYLTSEKFRKRALEIVNTFCDRHGIL
jgi:hypothetical protein